MAFEVKNRLVTVMHKFIHNTKHVFWIPVAFGNGNGAH